MNCGNCSGLYSIYHEHRVVFENDADRQEFEFKKNVFGKYKAKKVKDEAEYIGIEDKSGK